MSMHQQVPVSSSAVVNIQRVSEWTELTPYLTNLRLSLVNVQFISQPYTGNWWLVDAGVQGSYATIIKAAEEQFGHGRRPQAIILTHAHFDHVGALKALAETWDVPIFAHPLERKYLDGTASYPPPDPRVGGGLMSAMSPLFPRGPIDVRPWLESLIAPIIPGLPGWQWIHTPGHTEGHISLWREDDRVLIAGDALITTGQESAAAIMAQAPELHGPPMYFTPDWIAAGQSVERLAALDPELIITGHGPALHGAAMRTALTSLANEFGRVAVPRRHQHAFARSAVNRMRAVERI